MFSLLPEPALVREHNLGIVKRLGFPLPPEGFPLVWDPGDQVTLREGGQIEARMAILNIVLACCFGMPRDRAMAWLLEARLVDNLTTAESRFILGEGGDSRIFALHHEAVFAMAWILGIAMDIDPTLPAAEGLTDRLPNLVVNESFDQWRGRTLAAPRNAVDVAVQLDLYFCLDWSYLESERQGLPLPENVGSNTIGQRRWALEWATELHGPHRGVPVGWDQVDLSV